MASSPPDQEQPPQLPLLHYKTWFLKVSIHCPGCKRKVKKVLQSIEGVYTTDIDPQQQKVIVTGNVEAETLIKKLIRNGRSAELWPEPKPILKEKKPKKNENSDDDDDEQEDDEHNNHSEKTNEHGPQKHGVRFGGVETFTVNIKEARPDERSPENVPVVERFPAPEQKSGGGGGGGGGGGAKKKKKKKKKKSSSGNNNNASASAGSNGAPPSSESEVSKMGPMDQTNLGHSSQHSYVNPYDHNPHTSYHVPQQHQSYVVSYNAAHPMVSSGPAYYYIPSSPYMHSDVYSKQQSTPLDSFEILSDENPHACYIM